MTPVHLDRRRFLGLGAAGVATLATARLTPAGAQTLPRRCPGADPAPPPPAPRSPWAWPPVTPRRAAWCCGRGSLPTL